MSANNIVVIKKEADGKFRGHHRDYDAYCEGVYDYEGPCPFCENGCDMCDGKGQYTPCESVPIFEADTIEEAICAYDKWVEEMSNEYLFVVEYGYTFEGLEPNAETIETLEKSERGEGLHVVDSAEELVEELNDPTYVDTVKLEKLANKCNRLKKILYDNREQMSNKDFIIISGVIRAENLEIGDNTVIETSDDIRKILKVKIEKIEGQIVQLVKNE